MAKTHPGLRSGSALAGLGSALQNPTGFRGQSAATVSNSNFDSEKWQET